MRTISPYSVFNGPRMGTIAKLLAPPRKHKPLGFLFSSRTDSHSSWNHRLLALKILDEVASIGSSNPDPSVAKHLACLIRENPDVAMPDHHHIIAAALVEKDIHGVPNVISSFQLDTLAKRGQFLAEYTRLFLDCFIPPMLKGLGFEAHGQNVLLRLNKEGQLVGFTVRDFGGVMYHAPTVAEHTGVTVTLLEGSSIVAETSEDAYRVFFHAGIQSHLHRIIRAVGLHHNGVGWRMVRENLQRHLQGHPLLDQWLNPVVYSKSLLSMKLGGLYRDVRILLLLYLFVCFPNSFFFPFLLSKSL